MNTNYVRKGQDSETLTEADAVIVRMLNGFGFHNKRIAALFDVNQGRISEVVNTENKTLSTTGVTNRGTYKVIQGRSSNKRPYAVVDNKNVIVKTDMGAVRSFKYKQGAKRLADQLNAALLNAA